LSNDENSSQKNNSICKKLKKIIKKIKIYKIELVVCVVFSLAFLTWKTTQTKDTNVSMCASLWPPFTLYVYVCVCMKVQLWAKHTR